MARPDQHQLNNLFFGERLFTSKQAMEILGDGKTKFFAQDLPHLDAFLDGNKLKITGSSIQRLIEKRLAEPRRRRPTDQLHKAKTQLEESAAATKARPKQLTA